MGRLKFHLFIGACLIMALTFLGCQEDDNSTIAPTADHKHVHTQKVDLQEFPEVMQYLQKTIPEDFQLQVNRASNPRHASRNNDLLLLNIDIENATQSWDENDTSNFSIAASAETVEPPNEFRFITYNLVIAEYADTHYSFVVEYEYDRDWIAAQPVGAYDYTTFTGYIRFYDIYGQFVQEHTYANGTVITSFGSDPCGDDDGDPNDNPDGGDGPTIVITCGCDPSHNGGSNNPLCSCTLPDIITIYNFGPKDGDASKDPLRSADPCGPGPGGGDGGDPGGGDIPDLPDECFLPNGDPIDCENPNIPLTPQELQENYFSLLDVLENHVGDNFWTSHMDEVFWLGDNKQIASDLLYLIMENSSSDEIFELVLNTLAEFITYTPTNYPGMTEGYPFDWWNDESFIKFSGNFNMPADNPNHPDEIPNAKEAVLFRLFPRYAALHIQNSITALNRAEELAPTYSDGASGLHNGKADAFRHAFWNAMGAAEFGSEMMKLFADAHEWLQADGDELEMDFFNNHWGRQLAISYGYTFDTPDATISNGIELAVSSGLLKYIYGGSLIFTNLP